MNNIIGFRNSFVLGLALLAGPGVWAQVPTSSQSVADLSKQLVPGPATLAGQAATQLPDGRWLLTGGASNAQNAGNTAWIVDGKGNTALLATHMTQARAGHSASLLPSGQVLIFGGIDASGNVLATAESFDPSSQIFHALGSTGMLARSGQSATVLASGQVMIAGGIGTNGQALFDIELYQPQCETACMPQRFGANLSIPREGQAAALLPNGGVLFWGGMNTGQTVPTGELANITGNIISPVSLSAAQQYEQALDNTAIPAVVDSQPVANAQNAPIDQPLVVTLSERMSLASFNTGTVTLVGPNGKADINPIAVEYGVLLFVTPTQNLLPGSSYTLFIDGALNQTGQALPFTAIGFTTVQLNGQPAGSTLVTPDNSSTALIPATAATSTQAGSGTDSESTKELMADGEIWIPQASNYHGLWNSNRAALAKLHPPRYEELQRSYSRAEMMFDGRISPEQREAKLKVVRHAAAAAGVTALVGQAIRLNGDPLAGVTVRMGGHTAVTDANGEFLLTGIPSGTPPGPSPMLEIDGRSASNAAHQYGRYFYLTHIKPGQVNALRQPIWMTALDTAHAVNLSSPSASETVVTNPLLPGLEVHIPAGAVIRDADGKIVTQVSLTPVPNDQLPFPMPYGQVPVYYTLQPGGAVIQSATGKPLGAKIVYPNYSTEPAGARFDLFDYDPGGRGWYVYGKAVVSPDGKHLLSDKDFVLYQFTASSATGSGGPKANGPSFCKTGGSAGDPVSCQEGMFYEASTDLAINDTMPLVLERSYHSVDTNQHAFGMGASDNFDAYLYFPDLNGYIADNIEVVLGDGSATPFAVVGSNNNYIQGAVYQSTTPGPFYMAKITLNYDGGNFFLTTKSGTVFTFTYYSPILMSIKDRLGNTVAITRDGTNRAVLVTSQNGHSISLQYESPNCTSCITAAIDNTGRQVSYGYDTGGNLSKVTNVAGGVETYSYTTPQFIIPDTNPIYGALPIYINGMQTVNDPRNNAGQIAQPKVTNVYYGVADIGPATSYQWLLGCGDSSCTYATYYSYTAQQIALFGRVKQQTYADGTTNQFSYTFDSNANPTTTITDGLGNVTVKTFQYNGNTAQVVPTQVVYGQGQPEQQTFVYGWNATNRLLQSVTDTLGRQAALTYDSMGNVLSVTRLAGTANAVTTSFTYTSDGYNHISAITDPLLHVTTMSYDSLGNLKQVQDANGNALKFSVIPSGQLASITNALGGTISFGYDGANMVSITDSLNNAAILTPDASGRVIQSTDPLGNVTQASLDAFNRATQVLDAVKQPTGIAYDPDGNITQVTDAKSHAYKYTYDVRNNPSGYTDPLNNSESYVFDADHNLKQKIDRKGQMTKFGYDHLNRLTGVTYADGSSIAVTYDGGNRITQVADSVDGTINYVYDGLDRLTSVTAGGSSVAYTYYANGLRQTMTASGQPTVTYTYDPGNRLTQISQAAGAANGSQVQNVGYTYDNANRLTLKTMPNSTSMAYAYDADNRLTGITYYQGSATIGNFAYGYDAAGNRVTIGGSFARLNQTTAAAATVDAGNRQTSYGGSASLQYDANGSLTNDTQSTYTWNARNQLVSIGGAQNATFAYDAAGRRISKSINGVTSNYIYDGWNIIGETITGTTYLTGAIDEDLLMETGSGEGLQIANYFTDALGSTIRLTDINGNKLVDYTYSVYGVTTADTTNTNPFQFVGRENDGDWLYYYRARYYDPGKQRFISQDPIGLNGGINAYAYVGGNPLQHRDPLGLDWQYGISVSGTIFGGVLGGGGGLTVGISTDGTFGGTSFFSTEQANAMFGGGLYAGVGAAPYIGHTNDPLEDSTGTWTPYGEVDGGMGEAFSLGWNIDKDIGDNGSASAAGAGPLGALKVFPGVGYGAAIGIGLSYASTQTSGKFGDAWNWINTKWNSLTSPCR